MKRIPLPLASCPVVDQNTGLMAPEWYLFFNNLLTRVDILGEQVSATVAVGSALALTSGVVKNIATITLPAGKWLVTGVGVFYSAATTVVTQAVCGCSTLSETLPAYPTESVYEPSATLSSAARGTLSLPAGPTLLTLTAPTIVYLVVRSYFTTSTITAYGFIEAVRIQ